MTVWYLKDEISLHDECDYTGYIVMRQLAVGILRDGFHPPPFLRILVQELDLEPTYFIMNPTGELH
jgi:hypothetical protein